MITLEDAYVLMGLLFAAIAVLSVFDRANRKRFGNAAFWALFAASFLFGSHFTDFENGLLVLALVIVGGFNLMARTSPETTSPDARRAFAARYGNGLFYIALIIPLVALIGTLFLKSTGLVDPKQVTLICLGFGVLIALAVAFAWMKPAPAAPLDEARRLADTIG
ncbi:MAG TPA: DUF979 family protein, partial [Rhizomicrobium sp.]|nr:DUF979 family protein [Rhizomicrobium sp.]